MKQVNIVGLGPSWRDAPEHGEIWGITGLIELRPVTRVIDMHDLGWCKEEWLNHYRTWIGEYKTEQKMVNQAVLRWHHIRDAFETIKAMKIPVYSTRAYPYIPTSRAYPLKTITAYFGSDFFASSFDYAIALAIYEGYDLIDVYGAEMSKAEYSYQKASFSYWMGIAKGMGITFKIHGKSELMATTQNLLYGYNITREYSCLDTLNRSKTILRLQRVLTTGLTGRLTSRIWTGNLRDAVYRLVMWFTTRRKARMASLLPSVTKP